MTEDPKSENVLENSLQEQIIDKMIQKLRDSEHFTDNLIQYLKDVDLSSKDDVKELLSKK